MKKQNLISTSWLYIYETYVPVYGEPSSLQSRLRYGYGLTISCY